MLNKQSVEKLDKGDGTELDVHSIFYTIQGEGPFAGTPAVFVRLAGCNLQCPFCDTEYTQGRRRMKPNEILRQIDELLSASRDVTGAGDPTALVVITGGEPFRQQLNPLAQELTDSGLYVQVESNGTLKCNIDPVLIGRDFSRREGVYLVISPKTGKVYPFNELYACAYKYVIDTINGAREEDGLPLKALGHVANPYLARPPVGVPIYVQPADMQNEQLNAANRQLAVDVCMKYGYTLQLQIHKLLGME